MTAPARFVLVGVGFTDEPFDQPFEEAVAILDEMAFRLLDDPTTVHATVQSDPETRRAALTSIHITEHGHVTEQVRVLLPR